MIYILIFIITLLVLYIQNKKNKKFMELAEKFPGPQLVPLLGNGLAISRYPGGVLHFFMNSIKRYGTVTRFWIGKTFYVYLTNPNDIEILLKDSQNIKKSKTYDFILSWLGQGLITSTGQHWHVHRKAITPAFHFNILEKFVDIFNEKGKILVEILKKKANGEIFNVFPYITLYTLDAILETSMGVKVNAQNSESEYAKSLSRFEYIVTKRIFNPLIHSDLIFSLTKYGKEHDKHLDVINSYCAKTIKERQEELKNVDIKELSDTDDFGKKKRKTFLDLLLYAQKAGNGFTNQDILEEVNTFMFAGHDTTAAGISFTIYCLAEHQEIQQKVYDEIVELFGKEKHDYTIQDLQKTQYLDMVVKESLRLYPPVPSFSRMLETDVQITDYIIPAGTSVSCFPYGTHRNPKVWPDPEVFDPERFSPENTKNRHPFAFIPFSAGPRNCIGQKYAMTEIKLTIIELLQNFKILMGKKLENLQSYITLTPTKGVNIRLEERK